MEQLITYWNLRCFHMFQNLISESMQKFPLSEEYVTIMFAAIWKQILYIGSMNMKDFLFNIMRFRYKESTCNLQRIDASPEMRGMVRCGEDSILILIP